MLAGNGMHSVYKRYISLKYYGRKLSDKDSCRLGANDEVDKQQLNAW